MSFDLSASSRQAWLRINIEEVTGTSYTDKTATYKMEALNHVQQISAEIGVCCFCHSTW